MKKKKCKCVIHVVKNQENNKKKVIITSLVGPGSGVAVICLFSKSLLPTTKVNGVSVGWLNVNAAEEN